MIRKLTIATALLAAGLFGATESVNASTLGQGNHPDSVWVRARNQKPTDGMYLEYSVDGRTWNKVCQGYKVLSSDFGEWGAQKKMYHPVLSVENGKVRCEFVVSPKIHQIAQTETEDLWLWKPQDYPVLSQEAFAAKMAQLKADSLKAVRVAYGVLDNLEKKMEAHRYRERQERDNMRGDDAKFKDLDSVRYEVTVDMTQKKAISPMLFGIFFEDINYAADGGLYAELVQNRDFEYNERDAGRWTAKTSWSLSGDGTDWSIRTEQPLHANNPHYSHLEVKAPGAQLANEGWDGIALEEGKKYRLSMFLRGKGKVKVRLTDKDGATLAVTTFSAEDRAEGLGQCRRRASCRGARRGRQL